MAFRTFTLSHTPYHHPSPDFSSSHTETLPMKQNGDGDKERKSPTVRVGEWTRGGILWTEVCSGRKREEGNVHWINWEEMSKEPLNRLLNWAKASLRNPGEECLRHCRTNFGFSVFKAHCSSGTYTCKRCKCRWKAPGRLPGTHICIRVSYPFSPRSVSIK